MGECVLTAITKESVMALRERAKTDLFWLAKELLGYDRVTEYTHRQLAEFFVQKHPGASIEQQDAIKDRLLLFPRGGFKSTFNVADVIQWILCFPDIRILILTGAADLGDGFISEIVAHFTIPDSGQKTTFQKLFPEHCISKRQVYNDHYTTPARKRIAKEPTVMAHSIESSLSGWHFELVKGDDVVTNRNSETAAGRRKVARNLHTNRKMLMPGGYWEMIGTRYASDDVYGEMIDDAKDSGDLKMLIKPAMWLKPGVESTKKCEDWTADEVELLFPENLTHQFLHRELVRDRRSFFLQYMNDPGEANDVVITPEDIRHQTVAVADLPTTGDIYVGWDLAYGTVQGRDHTAGAVGIVSDSGVYILDIVYGRFKPSELAWRIVDTARRWNAQVCFIEDAQGARFLTNDIARLSAEMNYEFRIQWVTLDTRKDAKRTRVANIEVLLKQRRIFFSAGISVTDEMVDQLSNFGITRYDDIPDAIAHLCRALPIVHYEPPMAASDRLQEIRDREWYDLVYGVGDPGVIAPDEANQPTRASGSLADLIPGLNC